MSVLKSTPLWRVMTLLSIIAMLTMFVSCGEDDPAAPPGNRAPTVPAIDTAAGAPADDATDIALATELHWTCTDPDGDALSFTVSFGTDPAPGAVSTDQAGSSYAPASLANSTTYYWQVTAKDAPEGATTASPVWSFTTADAIGPETVSTPLMPSGLVLGDVGQSITYHGLGALSSHGHAIQYRFDWGDMTMSNWAADTSIQNSWAAAGTYGVKSQARCSLHNDIESEWSPARMVVILDLETVSTPEAPTGPASGDAKVSLTYSTTGAVSSRTHALEYRFGWDFNAMSNWSTALEASHDWFNVGTYDVTVQARCQEHPDVESEWSVATPVEIVESGETISKPGNGAGAAGPVAGAVGEDQTFTIRWEAESNLGHAVEHQFDWADGEMSAWDTTLERTHAWATPGTYTVRIRGRCIEHPTAVGDWSESDPIEITDAAEVLTAPRVDLFANVRAFARASFYINGVTSSFGDPLEYQLDTDVDGILDWQDRNVVYHTYLVDGVANVRGRARCKTHPEVITDWSPVKVVNVAEANSGLAEPTADGTYAAQEITFTTEGAVNSSGHALEYQFYFDTGISSYFGPASEWSSSLTAAYTYDEPGTFIVKVQSRCTLHPEVLGGSSYKVLYVVWEPTTETITTPTKPVGPLNLTPNTPAMFSTTECVSNEGHEVVYRYRVQQGGSYIITTDWSSSPTQEITFTRLGWNHVYAFARCSIHPQANSARSPELSVMIANP